MFAYQDQYGWTVGAYSTSTSSVQLLAWRSPRTFATRAEAEGWIAKVTA